MSVTRALAPLSAGVICGVAAGAIAGAWARIAMRMVALGIADGVGITADFTLPGTFVIVMTGVVVGAPAGLVYGIVADRLPGPRRWRGLIYAAAILGLAGPLFFRIEEFFSAGRVLLFLPTFILYGVVLGLALTPLRGVAGRFPPRVQTAVALSGLGAGALLLFAAAATVFGLPSGFVM